MEHTGGGPVNSLIRPIIADISTRGPHSKGVELRITGYSALTAASINNPVLTGEPVSTFQSFDRREINFAGCNCLGRYPRKPRQTRSFSARDRKLAGFAHRLDKFREGG